MNSICILRDCEITPENNSKAHVIPSALGGTLKPKSILCRDANSELNDKFDNALIQAFHPLMALLGGLTDRSSVAPTKMLDADGRTVLVAFGQSITLGAPEFVEIEAGDGTKHYSIKARTMKEARTLLGRVKKAHPSIDIDEVMSQAAPIQTYLSRPLSAQLQIGPASVFPAVFGMAAIYATYCGIDIHPSFKSYVNLFPNDAENTGEKIPMPPDTFYWMPADPPFEYTERITHRMFLITCPIREEALFYVELFNAVCVGIKFPYLGKERLTHTYGVDIVSGTEIKLKLNEVKVLESAWTATHNLGDEDLYSQMTSRIGRILKFAHSRSQDHEIERIMSEEFGSEQITKESIGRVAERLAFMICAQMEKSN